MADKLYRDEDGTKTSARFDKGIPITDVNLVGNSSENPLYISGRDGKSAFSIAEEEGFEGTPSTWLESLKGADGTHGIDGKDGATAFELATKNGFTGTLEEWLTSLQGEPGVKGDTGEKGEVGEKGGVGAPGAKGATGAKGEPGEKGDKGDTGAMGLKGETGATGQAGLGLAAIKLIVSQGKVIGGEATLSDNSVIPVTIAEEETEEEI